MDLILFLLFLKYRTQLVRVLNLLICAMLYQDRERWYLSSELFRSTIYYSKATLRKRYIYVVSIWIWYSTTFSCSFYLFSILSEIEFLYRNSHIENCRSFSRRFFTGSIHRMGNNSMILQRFLIYLDPQNFVKISEICIKKNNDVIICKLSHVKSNDVLH